MVEVIESYHRAEVNNFVDKFYEEFLKSDPRIAPIFKKTDFKEQKRLLVQGVFNLLEYAKGSAIGRMSVNRLAETHGRKKLNIPPELYKLWVNSLMVALAERDPKFTPQLDMKWRQAIQKGIDLMISQY